MDYIFYDTETTGLSPYFDQILQFAAIRTDDEFNELERFEIRCRVQPHILANPNAMSVTKITASELINPNLPSYYVMAKVIRNKLLSWQPAIILGQNTLAFDEPMLRSAFYQNLFPTYLTNTNGNIRMDSLPILQAASILAPDLVTFPINERGNKSFKLDQMAPANGFKHQNAHEAMSDVEATIFMCNLIKKGAAYIWDNFHRNADKFSVHEFVNKQHPYALIRSFFGKTNVTAVTTIGVDPNNKNEILAYNLKNCPKELDSMSDSELKVFMSKSPKPILTIRANAMPSVWSLQDTPKLSNYINEDIKTINSRTKTLNERYGLKQRLINLYCQNRSKFKESCFVERKIYSGFPSQHDKNLMAVFHKRNWDDRWSVVQSLEDDRFKELGERLIYFYAPQSMPLESRQSWKKKNREKLLSSDPGSEWLTIPQAIILTKGMIKVHEGFQKTLLEGHLRLYESLSTKTEF